jgi:hypothetical protein
MVMRVAFGDVFHGTLGISGPACKYSMEIDLDQHVSQIEDYRVDVFGCKPH